MQECIHIVHCSVRATWWVYLKQIDCKWKQIAYCFTVCKPVLDCCNGIHRQSTHRNLQCNTKIVSLNRFDRSTALMMVRVRHSELPTTIAALANLSTCYVLTKQSFCNLTNLWPAACPLV